MVNGNVKRRGGRNGEVTGNLQKTGTGLRATIFVQGGRELSGGGGGGSEKKRGIWEAFSEMSKFEEMRGTSRFP